MKGIAAIILILAPAATYVVAQEGKQQSSGIYLIAATRSPDSTNLYYVARQNGLQLLRTVLTTSLYEIADDQQGTFYIIPSSIEFPRMPGEPLANISIIHEDAPETSSTVAIDQQELGNPTGDAIPAAALSPTESCLLFMAGRPPRLSVVRIMGTRHSAGSQQQPGRWSDYTHLRYAGNLRYPLEGWMDDHFSHLVSDSTVIAPAPPYSPPCYACSTFTVLAATERFIAISFSGVISSAPLWIYDKAIEKWQSIPYEPKIDMNATPYQRDLRIFGIWLAGASAATGNLQVRNLVDGKTVDLHVPAEGGEVLAMSDNGVLLYRSNDSLFSVSLTGERLGNPTLLVSNPKIADVHWAFWRTHPKTK